MQLLGFARCQMQLSRTERSRHRGTRTQVTAGSLSRRETAVVADEKTEACDWVALRTKEGELDEEIPSG